MPQRLRFERAGVSLLLLATVRCAFPDYNVVPDTGGTNTGADAGAGANEPGGSGGSGGSGGTGVGGTAPDQPGGAPGSAGQGDGGAECAPEQWPVDHCSAACLHRYPDHCYDGEQSGDEVAIDCGGSCQGCTNEACSKSGDCISGQCVVSVAGESSCYAPLTISYTANEQNRSVGTTSWNINLKNEEAEGGKTFGFRDLKLRYYFERSGLVEPLVVRATQSNLRLANGQVQQIAGTWSIERSEPTANVVYDAFVEVGFDDSSRLYPGDSVDLYQQMLTGDTSSSNFDQGANYSFVAATGAAFLHVVVLYQGRVIWGLEPQPANPRQCFARGVNLNGPAVTIDGNAWQSSMDAKVAPGGGTGVSQGSALFPAVTGARSTMMQSAFKLGAGAELSMPVDNGSYLLYLYAVSPGNDSMPSTFTVQGEESPTTSKFRSQPTDGGQVWARLGPFRVNVTDATLRLGVSSGAVSFAGLELWYPD